MAVNLNALHAGEIIVIDNDDDGPGTLRQAIANAQDGDVITVDPSLSGATITLESWLTVETRNLTINGNGIIITADATGYPAIYIPDDKDVNLTLNRIHFTEFHNTGAIRTDWGGVITAPIRGILSVKSCIFSNNSATGCGSVIRRVWSPGADNRLEVYGCTFIGNRGGENHCIDAHDQGMNYHLFGNVFYDNDGYALFSRSDNEANEFQYNVSEREIVYREGQGARPNAGNVIVAGNPLSSFVPTTCGLQTLPATLPAGYPTTDFAGNTITASSYAGAYQPQTVLGSGITSLSFSTTSIEISVGEKVTLTPPTYEPDNVPVAVFTYSVESGSAFASVDAVTGEVTGLTEGSALIRASECGGKTAEITVNVVLPHAKSVSLPVHIYGAKGATATLTPVVLPSYAVDLTVNDASWTSSNTSVATVANGIVTFVAPGTAVISVEATDQANAAGQAIAGSVTVTVEPAINPDGYYNRKSWTAVSHRNHGQNGNNFWNLNKTTDWTMAYPMQILDGDESSFWGMTDASGNMPNYLVIDMKQSLVLNGVTVKSPKDLNGGTDWWTGFFNNIYLYKADNLPAMTEFNVDWGLSFGDRNSQYYNWYAAVEPSFGNIDMANLPSEWTLLGEAHDVPYNLGQQNVVNFTNIPAGTSARYLIVVFPDSRSGDNEGRRTAVAEVIVKSPFVVASASASPAGYGTVTINSDKELYEPGDNAVVDIEATSVNPSLVSFEGWNLNENPFSTDAITSHNDVINDNWAFEALFSLSLDPTSMFNTTGLPIQSNAGTQHRGSLSSLIDVNVVGDNHSAEYANSRVKKYFAIEMNEASLVQAVSLINTDGSTAHADADGHAADFSGKRLSVYLTNTAPDGDLNIDGGVPAEWGAEQGFFVTPIFDVSDNLADTATVVIPTLTTPYKYVILVVEHQNAYMEVGGIRIYGELPTYYELTLTNTEGLEVTTGVKNAEDKYAGSITLTATPPTGYQLAKWVVNGNDVAPVGSDNTYTFTIGENTEIEAVFERIPSGINGISISHKAVKAVTGDDPFTIAATVDAEAGKDTSVDWTSSDPTVATVDASGVVTVLATGSVWIKATSVVDETVADSVSIDVQGLVADGGYFNRASWTAVSHRYHGSGGNNFWGLNKTTTWKEGYPMQMLDGDESTFWGLTDAGGNMPNYIVIDMKQSIELGTVTVKSPKNLNGGYDWWTGFWKDVKLYKADNLSAMTEFTVDWGISDSDRNSKYYNWYASVAPSFGDINMSSLPSEWTLLGEVFDVTYDPNSPGHQNVIDFTIPASTTARYLIVVFDGSRVDTRISVAEVLVNSGKLSAVAATSNPSLGTATIQKDKDGYDAGDVPSITLTATPVSTFINFTGWKLNSTDFSTNATATYTDPINEHLKFEAGFALNTDLLLNSTGWSIESNAGTHRGSLASLIDISTLGQNHTHVSAESIEKKYYAIDMQEARTVGAVAVLGADGLTGDALDHVNDFAGKTISVYMTDDPAGITFGGSADNIEGGAPAEWGTELASVTGPTFVKDGLLDPVIIEIPETTARYLIIVVERKAHFEFGGIRIWKPLSATTYYALDIVNTDGSVTVTSGADDGQGKYTGSVTVTATPPAGKVLSKWVVNSADVAASGNTYTFTIEEDTEIEAIYTSEPIKVTNTNDDGTGSLRAAVEGASDGDVIVFDSSLEGATITLSSSIPLSGKSITIEGSSQKILQAAIGYPCFAMNGDGGETTLTVSRLHFDGWNNPNNTGEYPNSTWTGTVFSGNNNNRVVAKSCIFTDNTQNTGGDSHGGVAALIANSDVSGSTITFYGCTFVGNNAAKGTVLFNHHGSSTVIGNLFVNNNSAEGDKSAINNGDNLANVDLQYNAYLETSLWRENTPDATNLSLSENPIDANYQPTTEDIKILPATLPADYPTVDFAGNAIAAGGYVGALQTAGQPQTGTYFSITIVNTDGSVVVTQGTPNGEGKYADGSTIKITATAPTDYELKGWKLNDNDMGFTLGNATITFVIDGDVTVEAIYESTTPATTYYSLTLGSGVTASGTVNGEGKYTGSVTVTATPASGYELTKWVVNGSDVPASGNTYTFTIGQNTTVEAVFTLIPVGPVQAKLIVTNTDDDGAGSLRAQVAAAAAGDTVAFAAGLANATITLERNIELNKSIVIEGSGQKLVPTGEGFPAFNIPKLTADGAAEPFITITRLWIEGFNNNATWWVGDGNGHNWGGAISAWKTGTLTVKSCVFKNNTSNDGGRTITKVWEPNGPTITDRFFAYGCTFISNVNENFIFLHEEPGVMIGNVFYNTASDTRDNLMDTPNGTVQYNAYNGKALGGGADGTNLKLTANPFDANLLPQGTTLQILPASLPAGYPTVDFAGNTIIGGGYVGAIQAQLVTGVISITPSHKEIKITKGDLPVQLSATVAVNDISNTNVVWKSSNTSVATVDATGKVTAVAVGEANIIASADADRTFTTTTKVNVLPAVVEGGYYNRASWTVAAHRLVANGQWGKPGNNFWNHNTETEWRMSYPMQVIDDNESSFWGHTDADGNAPNYLVIDLKQNLSLSGGVTVKSPKNINDPGNNDGYGWMTGYFVNVRLYKATALPEMTEFTADWGLSSGDRNDRYYEWFETVAPSFGDINLSSVPSAWTLIDQVNDVPFDNSAPGHQNVVDFENIPAGTSARYLIVVFDGSRSTDNEGRRNAVSEVLVKSNMLVATAKANTEGYGTFTFTPNKDTYTSGETANITMTATVKNSAVVNFDGWTLNGSDFSTNTSATYNQAITTNLSFVANFGLNLTGMLNSTGWTVGSNSGTAYRGELSSLVNTEELGDNHSDGAYSSRVKKYFTVEMPVANIVNAVSLINTDGSVKHEDADDHASDFAGKRLSVYLTNTAPDSNLDIDGGIPAEWGSEQGFYVAPQFDVTDNVADTATVVVGASTTAYKYVILVVEHKNDYIEVAGIRIWGVDPGAIYYTLIVSDPSIVSVSGQSNAAGDYTGQITLTANVPAGKKLTKWIINGQEVAATGKTYTFTIDAFTTVEAELEDLPDEFIDIELDDNVTGVFADDATKTYSNRTYDFDDDGMVVFRLVVTEAGTLTWSANDLAGVFGSLEDLAAGTNALSDFDPYGTDATKSVDLEPGTYYIALDNYYGTTDYELTTAFTILRVNEIDPAKEIKLVRYFDLLGRPVPSTAKGFVIKQIFYQDGTENIVKSYVKEK